MSAELVEKVNLRGTIETLETVFKDDPLAKDGLILGLKKELMCAHILNQQLLRIISALEWKQTIEYGKSQMRGKQIVVQAEMIEDLQSLLSESTATHKALRNKLEEIEFDISTRKELQHLQHCPPKHKAHFVAPFKRTDILKEEEHSLKMTSITSEKPKASIEQIEPRLAAYGNEIKTYESEITPLTYDNAIKLIRDKNRFCRELWKEISEGPSFKKAQVSHEMQSSMAILKTIKIDNDRLEHRVLSLQN